MDSRRAGSLWSLPAVAVVFAVSGCASTPKGQPVEVVTDPPGATARFGDQKVKTPGKLYAVPNAREMDIEVELEGYEFTRVTLVRKGDTFSECFDGNVGAIFAAPPGTIDVTAYAFTLVERLLLLALNCQMSAEGLKPAPVFVRLREIPPELKSPRP